MDWYLIIAQAIGVFGMLFNILSFQHKKQKTVITFQLFGACLFSIHFFMLGAYAGAMLNMVAIFRAIVFINKEKFKSDSIMWQYSFGVVYITSYILTFTVFNKEFNLLNGIVEFLPIIGMVATTVSFRYTEAKYVRRLGLVSVPSWLSYNIVNFSLGGIICEVFCFCSILIGMLRFDIKKK